MIESVSDDTVVAVLQKLFVRRPTCLPIIELFLQGVPRKAIATRLRISQHTLNWHFKRIYAALGINSAVSLARISTKALRPPPHFGGWSDNRRDAINLLERLILETHTPSGRVPMRISNRSIRGFLVASFAALSIAGAQQEEPCTECGGGEESITCGWAEPTTYGGWLTNIQSTQICYVRPVSMVKTCVNQSGSVVSSSSQFYVWCIPL